MNSNSLANLKNFKKGEFDPRRNLKGQPKKLPGLDKLLAKVLGDDEDPEPEMEKIIRALLKRAVKGDVRAAEVLLERGYGKPKQDLNINANIGLSKTPVVFK